LSSREIFLREQDELNLESSFARKNCSLEKQKEKLDKPSSARKDLL